MYSLKKNNPCTIILKKKTIHVQSYNSHAFKRASLFLPAIFGLKVTRQGAHHRQGLKVAFLSLVTGSLEAVIRGSVKTRCNFGICSPELYSCLKLGHVSQLC